MPFYVQNPNNTSQIFETSYGQTPLSNAPYSAVTRIYSPQGSNPEEGSAVVIAPRFALTAWHVLNDNPVMTKVLERASSEIGSGADRVGAVSAEFIRVGHFATSDLAVVRTDASFSLPATEIPGLYVSAGRSAKDIQLLENAYTAGHPLLHTTAQADVEAPRTQYVINVDASKQFGSTAAGVGGAYATWEDKDQVGGAGHSGGPLFITGTEGPEAGKIFVTGNFTWANATGQQGAIGNQTGVGGMLLRPRDKKVIDDLLKAEGYNASELPTDVISGSDGADRFNLASEDPVELPALTGSFKNEIIYGNDGGDIIYTGHGPANTAAEGSGDHLFGGAGADTLIVGNGAHLITTDATDTRSVDRLAILADSINPSVTVAGPDSDLGNEQMIVLKGGAYLVDSSGFEVTGIRYTTERSDGSNVYGNNLFFEVEYDLPAALLPHPLIPSDNNTPHLFIDITIYKRLPSGAKDIIGISQVTVENFQQGDYGLTFVQGSFAAGRDAAQSGLHSQIESIADIDGLPPLPATVAGTDNADNLAGTAAAEILMGYAGDDTISGGGGDDIIDGGDGRDLVDYSNSAAAVSVDLVAGTGVGGAAQGDILSNIET
jgi:Ca2+-binding RTX toxin-like protein